MRWYGLSVASAPGFAQNPLDQVDRLVAADIPIIGVVGLKDGVVPYEENLGAFVPKYRAAGGRIKVLKKPECDHHPHSLEDPTPVVEFIETYCRSL